MNCRIKKILEPLIIVALPILSLLLINVFSGNDINIKLTTLLGMLYLSGIVMHMIFKASITKAKERKI